MIEITLHNPTNKDIVDYPIGEAVVDEAGNPKIDPETQSEIGTGDTFTWNLLAGETKVFPKYVGDYLKKIYEFLEVVETPKESEIVDEEPEKKEDKMYCKICGKEVANVQGLGLHMASKHPDTLQ